MLRCDLHVHTNYSPDGESSVADVLARAAAVGLDAIAITDHDTVEGVRAAKQLESRVLVIPGMEVSTLQGHLIVLGLEEVIPAGMDFLETCAVARSRGGVLILPHPYHQWRHGAALKVKNAIEAVDAVESFNSRYILGTANKRAERNARMAGKPCVGGSDAHISRFIGFGLTLIDAEPEVESILDAIRQGRTIAAGRMTPLHSYTRQSMRGAIRRIKRRVHR